MPAYADMERTAEICGSLTVSVVTTMVVFDVCQRRYDAIRIATGLLLAVDALCMLWFLTPQTAPVLAFSLVAFPCELCFLLIMHRALESGICVGEQARKSADVLFQRLAFASTAAGWLAQSCGAAVVAYLIVHDPTEQHWQLFYNECVFYTDLVIFCAALAILSAAGLVAHTTRRIMRSMGPMWGAIPAAGTVFVGCMAAPFFTLAVGSKRHGYPLVCNHPDIYEAFIVVFACTMPVVVFCIDGVIHIADPTGVRRARQDDDTAEAGHHHRAGELHALRYSGVGDSLGDDDTNNVDDDNEVIDLNSGHVPATGKTDTTVSASVAL
jgi:hypothetical protein